MSLFSGINVALRALLAHQQAVEIVEHNIANANTPGYTRQSAVFTTAPPYAPPGMHHILTSGQIGSGVVVDKIDRFSYEFFDGRLRRETASVGQWDKHHEVISHIEVTLSEVGSDGLLPKLDEFWAGWQALSTQPDDVVARTDLLSRGQNLVDAVTRRALDLRTLRKEQDDSIAQVVSEVNSAASQIAKLNEEISRVMSVNNQPNDLMDTRDQLLNRLAEMTGAVSHTQDNGQVMVSIGGHALVVGNSTFSLEGAQDPTNDNLLAVSWDDGQVVSAPSGELVGLLQARDSVAVDQSSGLDALSVTLINQINTLHQGGYGINGSTGLDFFSGTDALSMRLSTDVTGDVANIASAVAPNSVGDGSVAGQIAEVQSQLLMGGGTSTVNQYYQNQIAKLGIQVQGSLSSFEDRQLVKDSLERLRESRTGVSLDEEAANLIKYQRAFQAAARLMTTVDSMLDQVINNMGLVGR